MSYTLEVSPLSGPSGLYLLDLADDQGKAHLWLATPMFIKSVGVNPAGVLSLRLDLFRKIPNVSGGFELVPGSKLDDIPVIAGTDALEVYRRDARTVEDGICLDLQNFPMRDRHVNEDYAYVLTLEDAPVLRIDFTRSNGGIFGIPTISTEPPPAVVSIPPPGPSVRAVLQWKTL